MDKASLKDEILKAHHFRHATRVYNEKKISDEDMAFILEVARLSPSSVGLEPWRFVVLENENIKQQISTVAWGAKKQLASSSHFVLVIARKDVQYDSDYFYNHFKSRQPDNDKLNRMIEIYKEFQTDHIEVTGNARALFDWSSKQTYIALANMMTAAALIGIDSCPIEGFDYQKVNAILSESGIIDSNVEGISVMVSFGYRYYEPRTDKIRKDASEVIQWVK
ncbi:NAD(P)H-dependent oxidoreductase [Macrococcoides caseolyticum]|uniref:NAD(P)H-dependent oxidoreductase n=1 Tax=Macrococcoides caseolyticum TaxID=69966 RepID=UPI001F3FA736|nr:NAD(P)H-dependent oxidoreductase [Macrococcus caseolyticus]MCE4956399.1 NAD(P)H-dependent oxidoreductase [Macrococcus caseolyticus]